MTADTLRGESVVIEGERGMPGVKVRAAGAARDCIEMCVWRRMCMERRSETTTLVWRGGASRKEKKEKEGG